MSRRRLRWTLALTVLGLLAIIPIAVAETSGAVHSSVSTAPPASTATAPTSAARARNDVHGVRAIPHTAAATPPSAVKSPPAATATPASTSSASPLANFNGVCEPPDQGLCVGNGYVVEMVNSAYTVYRPNGSVVTGPFNVNGPFDEGASEFTSDPRCYYDAASHTWYATILWIDPTFSHASRIDLAVNTSGDPTSLWTTYRIDTTDTGGSTGPSHPGCPCLGDQPTLGIDAYNVYITTNEFSLTGPQYNGAQIYAIPKSDLTTAGPPSAPAHFVHYDNLSIGGAIASSVQPALTTGSAPAEYFLNSLDPNATFDQRIGVWAMSNRAGIANGVKPTLSSVVMPSEAYGVPPGGDQLGSSSLINAGDDRMQQTQYINGRIWGALDTSVTIPHDPAPRAGAAWFGVVPTLSKSGVLTGASAKQGYVAVSGNDVLYPAIQSAPSGRTVMVVSITGAGRYPSAGYTALNPGSPQFGPVAITAAGTGPYDPNATRWGDYSFAVLDPSGKSVWGATEYIPPKASQTPDGARNWGTRVFQVPMP